MTRQRRPPALPKVAVAMAIDSFWCAEKSVALFWTMAIGADATKPIIEMRNGPRCSNATLHARCRAPSFLPHHGESHA